MIVDEKAGTDSVGTGIVTGFDVAVIVVEPTVYGIKAGKQIAMLLEHFKTPYYFVLNKVKRDTDVGSIEKELGQPMSVCIPFGENIDTVYSEKMFAQLDAEYSLSGNTRYERSVRKFEGCVI